MRGKHFLRDAFTVPGAWLAMPWAPWGVRVLEETMTHSRSSGSAVRQTLQQPQIFAPSQHLDHQASSFWKLPGTRLVLLEASQLSVQVVLEGSYIFLLSLGRVDPLGFEADDPSQGHSSPSSFLCCSGQLRTSASMFMSASMAASQAPQGDVTAPNLTSVQEKTGQSP